MENNSFFWNMYHDYVIKRLKNLVSENRAYYRTDLHIHSKYSSDGQDHLIEKIERAKAYQFDIMSVTDHDAVGIYDELYQLYAEKKEYVDNSPVIIPGVEYTVYYEKYYGLCHLLQYFIDPKSDSVMRNLKINERAFWNRSRIQFDRIHKNYALQKICKDYNIEITYEGYKDFLKKSNEKTPGYNSLVDYIFDHFIEKGIGVNPVKDLVYEMICSDTCIDRREKYLEALKRFEKRHKNEEIEQKGYLLLPLLAPVGIDDHDFHGDALGILTVNKYGQIDLGDLKGSGFYILAHPEVEQLDLLETDIPRNYNQIVAYEINKSNYRSTMDDIKKEAAKVGYFFTVGSDSHSVSDSLYESIEFYNYPQNQLRYLIEKGEQR